MELQDPSPVTKAMEKAADGLKIAANALESAAKEIQGIQGPVSPNTVKQIERIRERMRLIPDNLPEVLDKIVQLLKVVPPDLRDQLAKLNLGLKMIHDERMKNLKHVDYNNTSRVYNARLFFGDFALRPLLNHQGALIANFPKTTSHLQEWGAEAVTVLYAELGLTVSGDLEQKKALIREYIGCPKL